MSTTETRAMLPDIATAFLYELERLLGSITTLTDYPARRQVAGIKANPLVTVSDLKTGVWRKTYRCRDNVNLTPGPTVGHRYRSYRRPPVRTQSWCSTTCGSAPSRAQTRSCAASPG
jgi:hypothetical protein